MVGDLLTVEQSRIEDGPNGVGCDDPFGERLVSPQSSNLRRVEAPDAYWAQVINSAVTDDGLSFNQYRLVEHRWVEQWWGRHWDLAESP